jgi:Xaa-Pro aminopeptidase
VSRSPYTELYRSKLEQASEIMREIGLDAWLIFVRETALNPDPITELLWDFAVVWPGAFIITADGERIATGVSHDAPTLEESALFTEVVPFAKVPEETLPEIIARLDPQSIALNYSEEDVSSDGLSVGLYRRLQRMFAETPFPARFTSAEQLIGHLRQRKLPGELALMRNAVDIAGELFDQFTDQVRIGMSETDMARIFLDEVQRRGITTSWDPGHCPNLNAGPETGRGHVGPLPQVTLARGDIMNVDFGVVVEGYASDQQRVWYALRSGESDAPAEVKRHFYAVRDAIRAAFAALKPGALGWEVDDAARRFITGAGYPEYMHAVGHNVGRYCHDGGVTILGPRWPSYGSRAFGPVEPGMVVTLELGVWIEEYGYFGLEEQALVTEKGAEWFSPPQDELILINA